MNGRRKFFQTAFSGIGGLGLVGFNILQTKNLNGENPIQPFYPDFFFDLHSHPGRFFSRGKNGYLGDEQVMNTMKALKGTGEITGAFFSLVADSPIIEAGPTGIKATRSFQPGEAWKEYQIQLSGLKELLKSVPTKIFLSPSETNTKEVIRQEMIFMAVEGTNFLEGKLERIAQVYKDGIRSLQLVHYTQNEVGDIQTEDPVHHGLSGFGKELIRELNKQKILIDVAHASFKTTKQVAEITSGPIILSHTILETKGRPVKRAISEDHARLIAQTDGVIGMWPSGFNEGYEDFVNNTLRMIEIAGINHVGIGTDMDGNYKPLINSYQQIPTWLGSLKAKGLSEKELNQLAGGNALRVLEAVI